MGPCVKFEENLIIINRNIKQGGTPSKNGFRNIGKIIHSEITNNRMNVIRYAHIIQNICQLNNSPLIYNLYSFKIKRL